MTRGNIRSLPRAILTAMLFVALSPLSVNADHSAAIPIPPFERLPCTDTAAPQGKEGSDDFYYSGKLIFGRRSCALVKREVMDFIQSRVSNTMAYYYDGVLIDYTDDTGTPGSPSVGMCRAPTNLDLPICDIGRPDFANAENNQNDVLTRNPHTDRTGVVNSNDRCGTKVISADAISAVSNEVCFKNRPVPMTIITPGMAPGALPIKATGPQGCGTLRASVINNEIRDNQKAIAALMDAYNKSDKDHKDLDSWTKAQVMQGVLDDPQKLYSNLTAPDGAWTKFMRDAGPGNEYCSFSSRGLDLRTCGKETAWMRGFRIAIYQQKLEEVLQEISQGGIKLTNVATPHDPAYPCGEAARSVEYMLRGDPARCTWRNGRCMSPTSSDPLGFHVDSDPKSPGYPKYRPGIWALEDTLRNKYGIVENLLDGDATKACLGEVADVAQAQAGLATAFVDSAAGKNTKVAKQVSMAACNLAFAHRRVSTVFSKLASCEVNMRVKKDNYEKVQISPDFLIAFKKWVGDPCVQYAKDTVNYNPFNSRPYCFRSCATNNFYQCYRDGRPGDNIPSVTQFFYKYSREHFPYVGYENTGKPRIEKLKVLNVNGTIPNGLVVDKPVPTDKIPPCTTSGTPGSGATPAGGIMVFVFAAGRRGRERRAWVRRAARALASILPILALFFMAAGVTGCGGDDDDDDASNHVPVACNPVRADVPPQDCINPDLGPAEKEQYTKCAAAFQDIDCKEDLPNGEDPNLGGDDEKYGHSDVFNGNDVQTDNGTEIADKKSDDLSKESDVSLNAATAANRAHKAAGAAGGRGVAKIGKNAHASAATGNDKEGGGDGGGNEGTGAINITDNSGQGGGAATAVSNSKDIKVADNGGVAAETKGLGRATKAVGTEIGFGPEGHSGGGTGPAGPANSMSGEGGLSESDEYWGKITGKMTLFQVVSRRYSIWSDSVDGPGVVKKQ